MLGLLWLPLPVGVLLLVIGLVLDSIGLVIGGAVLAVLSLGGNLLA